VLITTGVGAQTVESEAAYPTVIALEQAVIPSRDRVSLARRFLGVTDIPAPPTSAPERHLGEEATFFASNLVDDAVFEVTATLRVIGQHIYFWVEDHAEVSNRQLAQLADAFDQHIYEQVRELWGSEPSPGIDGERRVHGLLVSGIGSSTAAYFISQHIYPEVIAPGSNEHEMFFYNLDTIGTDLADPMLEAITAHEFQHMIRANVDANESSWMDEGFSMFTERYLGYEHPLSAALSFMTVPHTQLNTWSEDGDRSPHYGASMMFVTYFYERYGLEGVQALSAEQSDGLEAVDKVLREMGAPGVNDLFADWVLANYVQNPNLDDGRYGYQLLWDSTVRPIARATIHSYPYLLVSTGSQYGAEYFLLDNLDDAESLHFTFAAPLTVELVPTKPASGDWMWYSNKNDHSDTMLTRAFDLSEVSSATLQYNVWYSIEELWDYGYVSVSSDGGETWTLLETEHTTRENPHESAYGPGYTGDSSGWIEEVVSLDDYAGQEILVRFEVITDDAIVRTGMAIDDVAIPEIGYASDFEADGGGWEAAGWLRTDNLLPQQVWIQAMQFVGDDVQISRWLFPDDAEFSLPLAQGVERVVLAVSPFAPLTTVPMSYTLNVSKGQG
jgi:hypothetical protein